MTSAQTLMLPTKEALDEMPEDLRALWQNKILVHSFFTRVLNERDLTAADSCLTVDYIQHNPGVPTGREGFKTYFANLLKNFPQTTLHIVKLLYRLLKSPAYIQTEVERRHFGSSASR